MQVPAAWASRPEWPSSSIGACMRLKSWRGQSTGASCSCQRDHSGVLASRTSEQAPCKRMHHAWAARRRPGLGWSLSGWPFGGEGSLSNLCLSTLSEPSFPVYSASGAKLLQLWSVLLAAISTSRAGQSNALAPLSARLEDCDCYQDWRCWLALAG
jgi:hypothetical protein